MTRVDLHGCRDGPLCVACRYGGIIAEYDDRMRQALGVRLVYVDYPTQARLQKQKKTVFSFGTKDVIHAVAVEPKFLVVWKSPPRIHRHLPSFLVWVMVGGRASLWDEMIFRYYSLQDIRQLLPLHLCKTSRAHVSW